MSRSDIREQLRRAIYSQIRKLVSEDGYSWHTLAEYSLYDGEKSLVNAINQDSYKVDGIRFSSLLKNLSNDGNLRMQRFVVVPTKYHIIPIQGADDTDMTIQELHHDLVRQIYVAEDAISAGNAESLYQYYRYLLSVVSKVRSEINDLIIRFDSDEDLTDYLMREERTPGVVTSRGIEKRNVTGKASNSMRELSK